ncbi:MAG: FHA domain-containing protein [Candidatus Coproplasma sp.]
MRKVKACPKCRYYNGHKVDDCALCGTSLSDAIIELVEDGIEYAPAPIEQEVTKGQKEEPSKEGTYKICPDCGELNPPELVVCQECGTIIKDVPLSTKPNGEIKPANKPVFLQLRTGELEWNFGIVSETVVGRLDFVGLSEYEKKFISRSHVKFTKDGDRVFIEDLSTNGTFVNGKKLSRNSLSEIHSGDSISFYLTKTTVTIK